MSQLFRILFLFLTYRFKPRVDLLGPCSTAMRVWPNDLDVYLHMNNGRYLTLLDLARTDLMLRSSLVKVLIKKNWYPVVASETIQFRKSLRLFQGFTVETRVIGRDTKAILIEHRFIRKNSVVALAVIRAQVLKKSGGSVTVDELFAACEINPEFKPLPEWIFSWNEAQTRLRNNG